MYLHMLHLSKAFVFLTDKHTCSSCSIYICIPYVINTVDITVYIVVLAFNMTLKSL